MAYTISDFHGFEQLNFEIDGRSALLVKPKNTCDHNRYLLKTEYFNAFPELEIEMLNRGYHLAYVKNRNRWGTDADCKTKALLVDFLSSEFGLYRRCIPVGMSCGGFHAVNFASRYPDCISLLYLDAPLLSFLSYPMGCGAFEGDSKTFEEITAAYGFDWAHALAYGDQPVHRLPTLIKETIPVALVYGDADKTVPCEENARILLEAYTQAGAPIRAWCKQGCDHHPHGPLSYTQEVIAYIEANMR